MMRWNRPTVPPNYVKPLSHELPDKPVSWIDARTIAPWRTVLPSRSPMSQPNVKQELIMYRVSAVAAALLFLSLGAVQAGEETYNRYCNPTVMPECWGSYQVPKGGIQATFVGYCGTPSSHTPAESIACSSPDAWTDCTPYRQLNECTCNPEQGPDSYKVKFAIICPSGS